MIAQTLWTVATGIPLTIALTVFTFLLGAVLALPLCACRLSPVRPLQLLATAIVLVLRSIPPIVWVFLVYFGLGSGYITIGPLTAAVVGLGLITAANLSEVYRGALGAIHSGQWEAASVLNLPMRSLYLDVIGPQVVKVALPSTATYAIGLLKDTAIASTIGVGEISFQAYHLAQRTFHGLDIFAVAGLAYILLSLPIAAFARLADVRMRARVAR